MALASDSPLSSKAAPSSRPASECDCLAWLLDGACSVTVDGSYAYVAIVIWPVGFPLMCCALFWYYEVPQIAALKIKRAEERAFLQHWTTELARLNKLPIGIDSLELQELNQMQLDRLLN